MLNAVTLGKDFASACELGALGNIHSIFDRAVNIKIINQEDSLLTLLCENIDIMPACLVAKAPDGVWSSLMKIDDKVIFTPGTVYVKNIPIIGGISGARRWERVSDDEIASLANPPNNNAILCACREVDDYLEKTCALGSVFPMTHISSLNPLELLGLGAGLTPSGDDFLAGMLYGVKFMEKLYGENCLYLPGISNEIADNLRRTGEISRHFLYYALKGEWGRNTEKFLVSLVKDDKEALLNAVDKKLSFGASSGYDELRGCLFGVTEYIKSR